MARGVNKAIIVGSLGNDPEIRYMPSGGAVASFSVATNEQWTDKQSGQKQERTEWHNITAFGKLAEIVGEYLKKGSQVYIEGKLRTEKWQDKSGNDRYTTEIVANEMQMLGNRGAHAATPSTQPPPQQGDMNPPGGQRGTDMNQPPAAAPSNFDDFDDDIPF